MPANPTPAEGVVVPIYPTEAMLDAAHGVPVMTFEGKPVYTTSREAEAIYLAMLAARPSAPTQSAAQTGEVDATLIEAQAAEIEEARKVIATINRVLSPQADRTFDLLISQSQWAVDTCRAFLASRTERAATQTTPASPPDGP